MNLQDAEVRAAIRYNLLCLKSSFVSLYTMFSVVQYSIHGLTIGAAYMYLLYLCVWKL